MHSLAVCKAFLHERFFAAQILLMNFTSRDLFIAVVVAEVQSALAENEFDTAIQGVSAIYCLNHRNSANSSELGELGACAGENGGLCDSH